MFARILLVDDNDDYRDLISGMLRENGYFVIGAAEPMAALDALAQCRPDVCIVDVGLPGMDGYELAYKIRRCVPDATILISSGHAWDHKRALEIGVKIDGMIAKPFTYSHLKEVLHTFTQPKLSTMPSFGSGLP